MQHSVKEFQRYLKRRYPHSSTAKHYVNDLRASQRLMDKAPTEIRSRDIGAFVEDQLTKGLAATTINRRLSSLHHFFEFLAHQADDDNWSNPVVWQFHRYPGALGDLGQSHQPWGRPRQLLLPTGRGHPAQRPVATLSSALE